jgi:high-affinity Fe2+/Pb2+ permease
LLNLCLSICRIYDPVIILAFTIAFLVSNLGSSCKFHTFEHKAGYRLYFVWGLYWKWQRSNERNRETYQEYSVPTTCNQTKVIRDQSQDWYMDKINWKGKTLYRIYRKAYECI